MCLLPIAFKLDYQLNTINHDSFQFIVYYTPSFHSLIKPLRLFLATLISMILLSNGAWAFAQTSADDHSAPDQVHLHLTEPASHHDTDTTDHHSGCQVSFHYLTVNLPNLAVQKEAGCNTSVAPNLFLSLSQAPPIPPPDA